MKKIKWSDSTETYLYGTSKDVVSEKKSLNVTI